MKRMKMMMLALLVVPFALVMTACAEGGAAPSPYVPQQIGTAVAIQDNMLHAWDNAGAPTIANGVVTFESAAPANENGDYGYQGGFIRLDLENTVLVFTVDTEFKNGEWVVFHISFNNDAVANVGGVNIGIKNDDGQLRMGVVGWSYAVSAEANSGIPNFAQMTIPVENLNNIVVEFSADFTTVELGGEEFDTSINAGAEVESIRSFWLVRTNVEEVAVSNIRVA